MAAQFYTPIKVNTVTGTRLIFRPYIGENGKIVPARVTGTRTRFKNESRHGSGDGALHGAFKRRIGRDPVVGFGNGKKQNHQSGQCNRYLEGHVSRAQQIAHPRSHAFCGFLREPAIFLALDVKHRPQQQSRVLTQLHRPGVQCQHMVVWQRYVHHATDDDRRGLETRADTGLDFPGQV